MGNEGKFSTEGREREPSVEKRTRRSKAWCVKKHGLGRKVTGPSHGGECDRSSRDQTRRAPRLVGQFPPMRSANFGLCPTSIWHLP